MSDHNGWRVARFDGDDRRREFIDHVDSCGLDGVEVETLDEHRVRFRAPARYEVGLAGMVTAHGGKMVPAVVAPEAVAD